MNLSTLRHFSCSGKRGKPCFLFRRVFCAVLSTVLIFALTGCSRGYISSYNDNISRSSFSLTAVSADFSGRTDLFAKDMCVPGEGAALNIGKNYASALFDLDGGITVIENNITDRI